MFKVFKSDQVDQTECFLTPQSILLQNELYRSLIKLAKWIFLKLKY